MRFPKLFDLLTLAFVASLLFACENAATGDVLDDSSLGDTHDGSLDSDGSQAEEDGQDTEGEDSQDGDISGDDDVSGDASEEEDDGEVLPPTPSPYSSNRSIGGMSMGAMSLVIALENPEKFDFVGALGGYPSMAYMMSQLMRLHFGGFCELADLEAALPDLDGLAQNCPTPETHSELEFPQSFNDLHFDDNGMTMARRFYMQLIDNFSAAFGNMSTLESDESPLLPRGVSLEWFQDTGAWERCQNAPSIPSEDAYSREHNPYADYAVRPLCDQDKDDQSAYGPGQFDPDRPASIPVASLTFIDLDGDGKRHAQEPLFLNPWERYEDVGVDGCKNPYEDGLGGCLEAINPNYQEGDDPNGDDYHWRDNPSGTEANDLYDEGEPFLDLGLDGLESTDELLADEGEGNEKWDSIPSYKHAQAHDAEYLLSTLPSESFDHLSFWLDAGIRDALHAGVVARRILGAMSLHGREFQIYKGFQEEGDESSERDDLLNFSLESDFSAEAIGRDIYVEYGNPDATPEEIAEGNGKHVGTGEDAFTRILSFLLASFSRITDPLYDDIGFYMEGGKYETYYSQALQARRGYTIIIPPEYDTPARQETRYPFTYFLHGVGQEASDLAPIGLATSTLMGDGTLPHAFLVFPDGACCFRDSETGERECACGPKKDGLRVCVDRQCEGPEESCDTYEIPDSRLIRECEKGSLYANMRADTWGNPRSDMNYKDSVMELVDYIDENYRTILSEGELSPVPED